ncbi:hypothetical protein JCM8547_004078 [Rhodosporidiobolus lusitaniae]
MGVPSPPAAADADPALESYLLALLSDSNLPTGGFVASSGLESYIQHGYLSTSTSSSTPSTTSTTSSASSALLDFVAHSLHSYARVNVPLLRASHAAVHALRAGQISVDEAFERVVKADGLCEALTLNHVARRASVAQGGALFTLYERAFVPEGEGEDRVGEVVGRVRGAVRRTVKEQQLSGGGGVGGGGEGERAYGHMTVAFGVLTAGMGLSLASALPLLLFLHARSLLSSAVRVNTIGPYAAHRVLLWDVRGLVDAAIAALSVREEEEDGEQEEDTGENVGGRDWWDDDEEWKAIWEDDPLDNPPLPPFSSSSPSTLLLADYPAPTRSSASPPPSVSSRRGPAKQGVAARTPVTTWPLGEIVASRHDQLFTKVFNS